MIPHALPAGDTARLYHQAAMACGWGAWECVLKTEQLAWTDEVYDLFGFKRGTTLRRADSLELYHDDSRREMEKLRAGLILHGRGFTLDARIRSAQGEERWMRLSAQVAHENGRPVRIFGAKQDITAEKQLWTSLSAMAYGDALTGLANRRAFDEELSRLSRRARNGAALALALVDLDHFKRINDRHGHAAGDACLRETALRLTAALPRAQLIARLGGDEFAVLLQAPTRRQIAAELARALATINEPILWNRHRLDVGASIGAAFLAPAMAADMARLFADADAALYLAKAEGRHRLRLFGQALTESPLARTG